MIKATLSREVQKLWFRF